MLQHFNFLGFNPSTIKLNQFEKDLDYTTHADENGEFFEEHLIELKGDLFDRMTIRVSEHEKTIPEVIWFEKDVCSLNYLIKMTGEITRSYGSTFSGVSEINPFVANSNEVDTSFSFIRRWEQLELKYRYDSSPQLSVTAILSEKLLDQFF